MEVPGDASQKQFEKLEQKKKAKDKKIFTKLLRERVKMLMFDKDFLKQIDKEITKASRHRKGTRYGINKYISKAEIHARKSRGD